jgi:hypothetical protein
MRVDGGVNYKPSKIITDKEFIWLILN